MECAGSGWQEPWRVDAHADEHGVGVGGWWPTADSNGQVSTWESPCLALTVMPESAPGRSRETGQVYRVRASLEALALLLPHTKLTVQVPAS